MQHSLCIESVSMPTLGSIHNYLHNPPQEHTYGRSPLQYLRALGRQYDSNMTRTVLLKSSPGYPAEHTRPPNKRSVLIWNNVNITIDDKQRGVVKGKYLWFRTIYFFYQFPSRFIYIIVYWSDEKIAAVMILIQTHEPNIFDRLGEESIWLICKDTGWRGRSEPLITTEYIDYLLWNMSTVLGFHAG